MTRRPLLAALATLALAACAVPHPPAAGLPTPACRQAVHRTADELLRSLPGAGYDCAESIAHALAATSSPETIDRLFAMSRP
ncbi:MAG TPA: hypothetical protein VNL77_23875, partial [Roseiflexaceae bacterium]|nr:hypothetical protein [Roseiflexaceae bacterium]